ncbi:MAG TPA: ABC transporter permease [Streptosporangiaceae bacterium]|jgi:lipooligosaccharide transport system permease protein
MTATAPEGVTRRFEWAALTGIWYRELTLYKRYWMPSTFAAIVEPVLYLLAFGFGLGSLVGAIGGYRYIDFLATGIVAMSVLFVSAFTALFATFVRRTFQHSYEAILAAPVDVHEVVTAEASWIAVRSAVYGCAPLLVALAFGLRPSWGMLLVPLIGLVTGMGFALWGIWMSALVPSINTMDYVITGVITPLFLVAGTFFPLSQFPSWIRHIAALNPLYHTVELVRHAATGWRPLADLGHLGALVLFCGIAWLAAVTAMRRRLID